METIKNIAAVIGCILSVISLVTICSKSGRTMIRAVIKKNTAELVKNDTQQNEQIQLISKQVTDVEDKIDILLNRLEPIEEVVRQNCRDTIKTMYYQYYDAKKLPLYERKTLDKVFEIYATKLNGNSYAKLLRDEMIKWPIDGKNDFEE